MCINDDVCTNEDMYRQYVRVFIILREKLESKTTFGWNCCIRRVVSVID